LPSETRVHRAVCPHDCWDTCGLQVTVRDGRVVRVDGDPEHPVTRGFICNKVRQYPARVHGTDRVLYPHRRVGRKGEGRFARIGWDEAIATIAERFRAIIASDGPEAILPYSYAGTMGLIHGGSMDRRFFHKLGASVLLRTICTGAAVEAMRLTLGTRRGPDPLLVGRCRLILVWGLNVLATNIHQAPLLEEARRHGAQVVCIDPFRHETAERADWFLQIRPGTDAALALGMMRVLRDEGLCDRDYLARYTVGWEALQERLDRYPPERVAAITGLRAADVVRLARLYGTVRPSLIRLGYGLQRHSNSGDTVRAIAVLPAVVGAWRDVGGGLLLSNSGAFPINQRALTRPDLLGGRRPRAINMIQLGQALCELRDPPVRALFVYNSNPAAVAPDGNAVRRGLAREDLFTVVHEQVWTDTTDYADIVLPATTQLEHRDLHTSYWHLYLGWNEPAIAPLGESKPNAEVFRLLAAAMGFDDPAFRDSDEDLARQALSGDHPALAGITLERLRREGYVRLNLPVEDAPFAAGGFPTPSGRVEIWSEELARRGRDPLPDYRPLAEGPEADPERQRRFPLLCLSPKSGRFLNSTFAHLEVLRRREGDPVLHIHPADAAARGIADGDWVRVWNDRGECRLRARVGPATRPGTVITRSTHWNRLSPGGGNVNRTTSQRESDLGGGATFYTNLVEVERAEAGA
jgi:anaerobic selenocysteine-containing dehydrogenase